MSNVYHLSWCKVWLTNYAFLSHREVLSSIVTVCHSRCPLYQSVHILDECLRFCCHLVRNTFRNFYHSILMHIELLNTVLMESLIISFANFHLILPLKYIKIYLTGKLVLSIFVGGISILLVLCHSWLMIPCIKLPFLECKWHS